MKKKILVITQNFTPEIGSAANRMQGIANYLSKNFEVTILTTDPQYPKKEMYNNSEFSSANSSVYCIKRIHTSNHRFEKYLFARFVLYLEVFIKMLNVIRKEKGLYDSVFVTSPPLSIPLVGLFAKRKFKAKLIVDIRDLWPESFTIFKGTFPKTLRYLTYMLEKIILHKADKLVINSEGFLPYIRKIVGSEKKIHFLPNSLTDEELTFERVENNKKQVTVIYAGNMGHAQDLESLFQLAKRFKKNSRICFVLIGYGANYQKIKKRIQEEDLNIEIKQAEPRKKVLERLQEADIAYVGLKEYPVFQTVLPGKIIDYMSASLPILGVINGYSKEVIKQAEAGIVYPNEDIEQIVACLKEWIDYPEKRIKYGKNGKKFAEENYNWQINQDELIKIIIEE